MTKTFKIARQTATLTNIEDPTDEGDDFSGIEVEVVVSMDLGKFLALGDLQKIAAPSDDDQEAIAKMAQFVHDVERWGDEVLVKWNLTHDVAVDGKVVERPIPANGQGMKVLPQSLVMGIITAWMEAIGSPSAAEKKESANGSSQGASRKTRRASTRGRN